MTTQISTVQFHGHPLITIKKDHNEFVAMRPVVEGIGLAWGAQSAKLNKQKEKFGCFVIETPSKGGTQKALCIPLRKLNGWLFSINPEKIKPELRERVIQYQEQCFEVLHDYWHHKAKSPCNPPSPLTPQHDTAIRQAVFERSLSEPVPTRFAAELYKTIAQTYGVKTYKQIPDELFEDVLCFVRGYGMEVLPVAQTRIKRAYDAPFQDWFTLE